MTAAEELHAAAEKLRALAARATPGPWAAEPVVYGPPEDGWGEPSNWEITSRDRTVVSHQQYEGGGIDHGPNAALIAAMHPGVGAALADWLEYQARYAALYDSLAGRPATDPHPDAQTRHALAVARQILGSQS